jgi:hypothetical protein
LGLGFILGLGLGLGLGIGLGLGLGLGIGLCLGLGMGIRLVTCWLNNKGGDKIKKERFNMKTVAELEKELEEAKEREVMKEVTSYVDSDLCPFSAYIGKSCFIRTVTMYYIGRVKCVYSYGIVLEKVSWVASTGKNFSDMLENGIENTEGSDFEPFVDDVIVNKSAIVDFTEYRHSIDLSQR